MVTPEEDYLRLVERLHRRYGKRIETQQDLNIYLSDMVGLAKQDMTSNQKEFYEKVKDKYIKKYVLAPALEKIKKGGMVERAAIQGYRQRDFNIIGKIKNKIVYVRKDALIRRKKERFVYRDRAGRFAGAAQKEDKGVLVQARRQRYFNIIGKIKNKTVYVWKDNLMRRKAKILVYRDKTGRFAKVSWKR